MTICGFGTLELDIRKVEATTKIEKPITKQEQQCFLGMVYVLAKFFPHLSERTSMHISLHENDNM